MNLYIATEDQLNDIEYYGYTRLKKLSYDEKVISRGELMQAFGKACVDETDKEHYIALGMKIADILFEDK